MALIVGKRRMTDIKMGGDVLMSQSVKKKWCVVSEASDSKTTITIPSHPMEKLKVVFPDVEDKVKTEFSFSRRHLKKPYNVATMTQRLRQQFFKRNELVVDKSLLLKKRRRR